MKFIGKYELVSLLGRGGMGRVYQVKDGEGKEYALKLLLPEGESTMEQQEQARRLRDEAKAAGNLHHSSIVKVFDSGDDGEYGPYIVYQLLTGKTFRDELDERGALPLDELLERVGRPILGALGAMHEAGIVHRDMKPENLFRGNDGNYLLGDFGLARFEGREAKTKTGLIVGTPDYIAPEQLLAPDEPATARGDLYCFGLVLVEAMIGKKWSIRERLVRAPSLRGVDSRWREVLSGVLSPEPDCRPSSAGVFLSLLEKREGAGGEPVRGESAQGERAVFLVRRRVFWGIGLLVLLTLVAFWVMGFGNHGRAGKEGKLVAFEELLVDASTVRKQWPFLKEGLTQSFVDKVETFRQELKNLPLSAAKRDEYWKEVAQALGSSTSLRALFEAARLGQSARWLKAHLAWREEVVASQSDVVGPVFQTERMFFVKSKGLVKVASADDIHEAYIFYLKLRPAIANCHQGRSWLNELFDAMSVVMSSCESLIAKDVFSAAYDICKSNKTNEEKIRALTALNRGWIQRAKDTEREIVQLQKAVFGFSSSGFAGRRKLYRDYYLQAGRSYWAMLALLYVDEKAFSNNTYFILARTLANFYPIRVRAVEEKVVKEELWGPFLSRVKMRETYIVLIENLAKRVRWSGGCDNFDSNEFYSITLITALFEKLRVFDEDILERTADEIVSSFPESSVYRKYALGEKAYIRGRYEQVVVASEDVVKIALASYEKLGKRFRGWLLLHRTYTMRWYAMSKLGERYGDKLTDETRNVIFLLRERLQKGYTSQCQLYGAAVLIIAADLKKSALTSEFAEDIKRCTDGSIGDPFSKDIIRAYRGEDVDISSIR